MKKIIIILTFFLFSFINISVADDVVFKKDVRMTIIDKGEYQLATIITKDGKITYKMKDGEILSKVEESGEK